MMSKVANSFANASPAHRAAGGSRAGIRRQPRGTMLVLFVILVPILFGLGALVLDIGAAHFTRIGMQTAVDAGAMEGLRNRDDPEYAGAASKRAEVARTVALHYDDDGDTTFDDMDLGAGKEMSFFVANPGTSLLNERRSIDGASIASYKPALQANLLGTVPDMAEGDMLAGTYNAAARHDEGYTAGAPYVRDDFSPAFGATDFTAFLVRMRRSIRPDGVNSPFDNIADVSSAGATIPLLFGRLSTLKAADPSVTYSARHNGITIRATGIAQGVAAMSVGPTIPAFTYGALPTAPIAGLAPFAVDLTWWNALTVGVSSNNITWISANGDLIQGVSVIGHTIGVWRNVNSLTAVDNVITLESQTGIPALVNPKNQAPLRVRMRNEVMRINSFIPATTYDYNVTRGQDDTTAAAQFSDIGVYLMDFLNVGDPVVQVDRPGGNDAAGNNTRSEIILGLPTVVYVPIYTNLGAPYGERIVGFGAATIGFDGAPALNDLLTLTKNASVVAPRNASATPKHAITGFPDYSVDPVPWDALFTNGRNTIDQPLLAPASVRSYSK